jgi:hypothetical protein
MACSRSISLSIDSSAALEEKGKRKRYMLKKQEDWQAEWRDSATLDKPITALK